MREPDLAVSAPVLDHLSSPWLPRRRVLRRLIHLRPTSPYLHRRVMAWALVEEVEVFNAHDVLAIQARRAPSPRTEPCYLRVAQRTPRMRRRLPRHPRRRMHRGLLRSRVTCSPATLAVPGVRMGRPLRIILRVRRAKIHVSMLVEAVRRCRAVKMLLLTLLGV